MRVAIWAIGDFEEGHAANARIKALCEGLKARGHHLELLLLAPSEFNKTGINRRAQGRWAGVPFRYFSGTSTYNPRLGVRIWRLLRALVRLSVFICRRHNRYDAFYLYAPNLLLYWPVYLLAWYFKIAIVAEMTELRSICEGAHHWRHRMLRRVARFEEKTAHRFWDHLMVISHELYQHYRPFFPEDRISILPVMVDLQRFAHLNGHVRRDHYIGYLGSFARRDNVAGIIEAFGTAYQRMPSLKLRLMGFNRYETHIRNLLAQYLIPEEAVELTGQLHFRQIPDLLYACDLLVINRDRSAYARYGFPTKLGEYLATGRPTVVTRVGDVPRYFTDGKELRIIEPEDPETLTELMVERFERHEEYEKMGAEGRRWAECHLNHKKIVAHAEEILEKTIARKQEKWVGDRWVSNPRPPEPQSGALTN